MATTFIASNYVTVCDIYTVKRKKTPKCLRDACITLRKIYSGHDITNLSESVEYREGVKKRCGVCFGSQRIGLR